MSSQRTRRRQAASSQASVSSAVRTEVRRCRSVRASRVWSVRQDDDDNDDNDDDNNDEDMDDTDNDEDDDDWQQFDDWSVDFSISRVSRTMC